MTTTAPTQPQRSLAKQPATAIIGYGLGDFAMNLAFSMGTAFLLYYLTDVAGLAAAAVGTMFLVVRLGDAFTDLFAGRMVDKTMTKWGKFRPFLLWFAVPVLFLSFLNFNVPAPGIKWLGLFEWNLDSNGRLLYIYLAYAVLGLFYSLINIPYGSLASAMTQSVNERSKLVASRAFGSAIGGVMLTYIVAPQISAIQKTAPKLAADADATAKAAYEAAALIYRQNVQGVFTQTTLWFILLGSIAYFVTFLWCRETVVRTSPKVSIKETFATLKDNKPLAYLCAASFFYLIGLFAVGGSTAFYAKYVLGDISQTANMTLVNSGIALLITPLIPAIIKKLGKKTVFQYCGIFTVIGGVALFFVPTGGIVLALVFLAVKGIGASLINTVMFGLEADTVEYGEWKTGKRTEGATYAIFSFTRKVTQSLGGALGAWLLAIGGYLSASALAPNPVQPESAILAIKFTIGLLPAIAAIIAMAIFWKYPLTDKLFREIRDENEARKLALVASADETR
ncbi:MAG: glycoside-pentoside-hexuronide (GPH):cation symporter [Micropruina sp.]